MLGRLGEGAWVIREQAVLLLQPKEPTQPSAEVPRGREVPSSLNSSRGLTAKPREGTELLHFERIKVLKSINQRKQT